MAQCIGTTWTKSELRRYLSDMSALAGAYPYEYTDGKATGVKGVHIHTGTGLEFEVIPGRAMDIYNCRYRGLPLQFSSATGMTHPGYYEETGIRWLKTFFGGLLSTCGITYSGAPSEEQGQEFGLHGRIGNAAAEDLAVSQQWLDDEYIIAVSGRMREATVMGENLTLTRRVTTSLGKKSLRIEDEIENLGFESQPLMLLYHFNFGFPLLSPDSRIVAPIMGTKPRDKAAEADNGIAACRGFQEPLRGYKEKVFFHDVAADSNGNTFVALINDKIESAPLGIVIRYNKKQLPQLTQWKTMAEGCYVCGLEPGTVNPIGRAEARRQGVLPFIEGQQAYRIDITFEIVDSKEEIDALEKQSRSLTG